MTKKKVAMQNPKRGEVWLVDFGYNAKVRPSVVLSIAADGPNDRVIATCVPHTTSVRSTRFEVSVPVRFLDEGAFDAQGLLPAPHAKFIRRRSHSGPNDECRICGSIVAGSLIVFGY